MRSLGMLLSCLILAAAGAGMALTEEGLWDRLVGGFSVLFFGFGATAAAFNLVLGRERPRDIPPPFPLPDEQRDYEWFEDEDPDESNFTSAQAALLDTLRNCALSLPSGGASSYACRKGEGILAAVTLFSGHIYLLNFGIEVSDGVVRGGHLRGRYELASEPSSMTFTETGRDDDLINRSVAWFDEVLRRPVERLEWWRRGAVYAVRYQFADTGEGLVEAFPRKRGLRRGFRPGAPDATVAVRADGRALVVPRASEWLFPGRADFRRIGEHFLR